MFYYVIIFSFHFFFLYILLKYNFAIKFNIFSRGLKDNNRKSKELIIFIDSFLLYLEGGSHFKKAFNESLNSIEDSDIKKELYKITSLQNLGLSINESLFKSLENSNDEFRDFINCLLFSIRFGLSVKKSLEELNLSLKKKLKIENEIRISRIPIKMIFPLVLFIFPAIFLILSSSSFLEYLRYFN